MATYAIQDEYAEDAADFIAEMRENGREAKFGILNQTGTPQDPSGEFQETGTAPVFPIEWQKDFSQDVRASDLFFFVGAEAPIEDSTIMVDDFTEYTVIEVKPFKPDEQIIFYEIQVRL